jgi:hypothetical protein
MSNLSLINARSYTTALVWLATLMAALTAGAGSIAAQIPDSKVAARYTISFNGIGIGTFWFNSDTRNGRYDLEARAKVSVLSGMLFDWRGDTQSSGQLSSRGPVPSRYKFEYRAGEKGGNVELDFSGSLVRSVSSDASERSSRRVPIQSEHRRNVVDPLSSVISLSQIRSNISGPQSCDQTLRIYDGMMRYDLVLSYKATREVASPSYTGRAFVCRVKFVPIAGHRADKRETTFMEQSDGIELWLVPARDVSLLIPYYILLPLPVGFASMTSDSFSVEAPGKPPVMVIGSR